MATNAYVKSLLWLVSLGGLGITLLKLTEPSEEKKAELRRSIPQAYVSEERKKKLLFLKRLEAASAEAPVYLPKEK